MIRWSIVVLLFLVHHSQASSFVYFGANVTTWDCPSPQYEWARVNNLNLTAPVIYMPANTACFDTGNLTKNMIVLSLSDTGCTTAQKLTLAQKSGAVGLVIVESPPAGTIVRAKEYLTVDVKIPVLAVQRSCLTRALRLLSNRSNLIVATLTDSPNDWIVIYDHPLYYIGQALLGFLSLVVVGFSILGLYRNITSNRSGRGTKSFILVCEAISCFCTFLVTLDIASSRGVFSLGLLRAFIFTAITMVAQTNLLVAFFFLELFHENVSVQSFLRTYRYPFAIIFLCSLIVRLICEFLVYSYVVEGSVMQTITGFLSLIQHIFAIIVLLVVLYKCCTLGDEPSKYVIEIRKAITEFTVVCIILTLLLEIPWIVGGGTWYNNYGFRIFVNYCLYFSTFLSLYKIYKLVIVPLRQDIKGTTSGSSKDTSSKKKTNSEEMSSSAINSPAVANTNE